MPEWLIERGIGETRAALVEDGTILEARIHLDGIVRARRVIVARLTSAGTGGRNAVATDEQGGEYLLPRRAPGVTEGAPLTIEVTREAIPGCEPWKRPMAKISDAPPTERVPIASRRFILPPGGAEGGYGS